MRKGSPRKMLSWGKSIISLRSNTTRCLNKTANKTARLPYEKSRKPAPFTFLFSRIKAEFESKVFALAQRTVGEAEDGNLNLIARFVFIKRLIEVIQRLDLITVKVGDYIASRKARDICGGVILDPRPAMR